MIETSPLVSRQVPIQVTEHSSGELGTVAVTITGNDGQFNYYPLVPTGLNELHASIRNTLGSAVEVSFPGSILYEEHSRQMRPDVAQAGTGS